MTPFLRILLLLGLALGVASCATLRQGPRRVSISALQQLPASATLDDVRGLFGRGGPGLGPNWTYPCADDPGSELWFWYRAEETQDETAPARLVFVTLAPVDFDSDGPPLKILWPPSAKHLDAEDALKRYYQNIMEPLPGGAWRFHR